MNDFLRIDLSNFDNRKEEIAQDLMKAASEHGFFYGNFCSHPNIYTSNFFIFLSFFLCVCKNILNSLYI